MKIEQLTEAVVRKALRVVEKKYHVRLPIEFHDDIVKLSAGPAALNDILRGRDIS